jgi:hypothetical protein
LVEGGELCLAEHVVRRAAQGVLVAQDRVAQLGRRRLQDAAGAGGRGLRAVAPEDAGQDVLGGRGLQAVDAGEAVWLNCSVGEVDVVLRSSTAQSDIQGLSGLGDRTTCVVSTLGLRRVDGGRVPEPPGPPFAPFVAPSADPSDTHISRRIVLLDLRRIHVVAVTLMVMNVFRTPADSDDPDFEHTFCIVGTYPRLG